MTKPRVDGKFALESEQTIWRNKANCLFERGSSWSRFYWHVHALPPVLKPAPELKVFISLVHHFTSFFCNFSNTYYTSYIALLVGYFQRETSVLSWRWFVTCSLNTIETEVHHRLYGPSWLAKNVFKANFPAHGGCPRT